MRILPPTLIYPVGASRWLALLNFNLALTASKSNRINLPPNTKHSEVQPVIDCLTDGLTTILGEDLLGIYLYGSLATGDYLPGVSDIDLAVVLQQEINDRQFADLNRLHNAIVAAAAQWQDRLELAYISRAGLWHFRERASIIGIISPGEPFHRVSAGADWLISWYPLREDGIALRGPPVAKFVPSISRAEYFAAVREHIQRYRHSAQKPHGSQALAYIVLTLARGLYTLCHEEAASKIKAADWTMQAYPKWARLIKLSLQIRVDPNALDMPLETFRAQVADYVQDLLEYLSD